MTINALTRLAIITEVTPGTTPATPEFTIMRCTGENIDVVRKIVFSSELNGRRGQKHHAVAAKMAAGGFNFEFHDATFEALLESVMRNAWNTDALVDANTPKAFTVEATYETGTTDTFKRIVGAEVASMTLNLRAAEILTGSVAFMGRDSYFDDAIVGSATYVAGNTEPIMVGADFAALALDGLDLAQLVSLDMTINNNMRERMVLGSLGPADLAAGTLEVTGSLTAFLSASAFDTLEAFMAGTATGIAFELGTVDTKITGFDIPNVILSDLKVMSETAEGDVMVSANWRALQDSGISNSVLTITRNIDNS